ncbi:MAG TPA: SDR family NAD(P)-dependent oxidoreductase, partial [Solirubrobacteraceae bacterium]
MNRDDLLGGNVLVTGATGGIGQAIARAFAARGASLVLTGRRTEVLEPLAGETGARVLGVDLSARDEVERLVREAGPVDVLVNNAALPGSGDVSDYSVEEIDRALEVNLRAPIVLSKLIGEEMRARRRGHIVFISSISGKAAQTGSALYSATKFGLRGFSTSVREDWRDDGVGVSAVFPGFIRDAGMFAESGTKLPPGTGTNTPDEVADAVIRAVADNRAEIDVAPVALRLGAKFAGLAP